MKIDIDKILLNVLNDKASKQEYDALESWKKESQENLAMLNDLVTNQQSSKHAYKSYDKNLAWLKMESQITDKPSKVLPIIIGLLIIVTFAISFFLFVNKSENTTNEFRTQNEDLHFALEDKSQIWLKEGGHQLKVTSDFSDERQVQLNGVAYFEIAHDPSKPFTIDLGNDETLTVLGTSFMIDNTKENLDVIVYTGRVELVVNGRKIHLTKGDRAVKVEGILTKVKNTNINALSWKTDQLVFDNTNLTSVCKTLQHHFGIEIELAGNKANIDKCILRSKFTTESLENILQELKVHFDFEYQRLDKKVQITNIRC